MDFSRIASIFETLRLSPPSKLILLEGREFALRHYPPTPPDADTLIVGIESAEMAAQVKIVLSAVYAGSHIVWKVESGQKSEERLDEFGLEISSYPISLFVPSFGEGTSFEAFAEIVAHLRAPDGCPWDKEQTHQSLRKHLLEESYETLSAMDANDVDGMREEFGDLLLQIVLNSQIAYEAKEFNFTDAVKRIYDKIIRRHPHVFGDLKLDGVEGVLQNWEKLKEKERKGKKEDKGILDGVPAALPALSQAQEYQDRAARVGFDWPEIEGVLEKIREEIVEIKTAENPEQVKSELGDLFFVLVNLARWRDVDAESALREANLKFKKRFAYVENGAKAQGRNLSDMTLKEMDSFWNEAKRLGL
ncbi:MAG: nucleoside triphosphate pyrophosphohydrolase [Chloroflexi bacterium CFX1]|nr:nucleoside triphosphate pyrophosphohydrolase [Chloroflexi bacterium CFX1]MCQ3952132.1 nucleoside triphosphate pyrophosphohydrolase [Chloroflexota bacterium]MDL1918808.1 nucleoside triphosphate pyrophosphohydrolase [Chloroflexi bacterium CFX5]NUQ57949.1 nucleoside triphosphate pyrophosphohydrolase [Anaerolineales bacterium]